MTGAHSRFPKIDNVGRQCRMFQITFVSPSWPARMGVRLPAET